MKLAKKVIQELTALVGGKSHPTEFKQRWDICKYCEFMDYSNRCKKCGCFMNIKARLKKAKCPVGKW